MQRNRHQFSVKLPRAILNKASPDGQHAVLSRHRPRSLDVNRNIGFSQPYVCVHFTTPNFGVATTSFVAAIMSSTVRARLCVYARRKAVGSARSVISDEVKATP